MMITRISLTDTGILSGVIAITPPLNISKILLGTISKSCFTSRNKNTPDLDHKCNNIQGKTKCLGKPTPLPLDMLFRIRNQFLKRSFFFLLIMVLTWTNILLQMQLSVTDTTTRNVIRIIESFSTN